jgi:mannose-1-phosphate guanylyltransferase
VYAIILAGGGGTRLWPLSRPERPKPFLPLLDDRSLLRRTVDRLAGLVDATDVHVVTDRRNVGLVRAQLPDVPAANLIAEPLGRNTAAAIALATVAVDRPDDDVMLVLPADHLVHDEGRFRAVLGAAASVAARPDRALLTLGIEPTRPAVEYGYVVASPDVEIVAGLGVFRVDRFVEKPDAVAAADLLAGPGQASWNAGIFAWRRDAIRDALDAWAPEILGPIRDGAGDVGGGDSVAAHDVLAAAYEALTPVARSIDYAVMEPAAAHGRVRVVQAGGVGWSDLGGWTALLEALGAAGTGRVVQAGEPADLGADDLLVGRRDGVLELSTGPRHGILDFGGPTAVLASARPGRSVVEALLHRVTLAEGDL